jgi:tight adherence protein C
MSQIIIGILNDTRLLAMILAGIAAVATVLTLAMPLLASDPLPRRMKSVALEREKIRQRERERMARGEKISLRATPKQFMQRAVENFQLNKWVGQEEAREKLVQAGYRGHAPYVTYLFFRMVTPIAALLISVLYVFFILKLDKPITVKIGICLFATYVGMHLPWLFLKNKIQKRQLSIRRAFPDALDLLLICVESGMSIEAAFRKVSNEIGSQSIALAEEFTLTTAELSYLPDRRHRLTTILPSAPIWKASSRSAWPCSRRSATAPRWRRPCGCWRRKIATCACPRPRRRPRHSRPS